MAEKASFAIVGAGLMGGRHIEAMRQVEGARVRWVVDPSPKAAETARSLGCQWHGSMREMLGKAAPDGIILATPTPMHAEQAAEAIERGIPILVEKPIAASSAEAAGIVRRAGEKGVPVLVGHHRRHNPLVRRAHEAIKGGEIGKIKAVHCACWLYKPDSYFEESDWRKRKGAGPVSVNLVHDIDLIRHLCGEISEVQASFSPSDRGFENEDAAAALLRFGNGAVGTVSVSDSVVSPWSWELTAGENPAYPQTSETSLMIGGSEGSLSIPRLSIWSYSEGKSWWRPISEKTLTREASDPLVSQLEHFVEVVAGRASPAVSGEDGLRTLEVIDAIFEAARTGRIVEPGAASGRG